VRDNWYADWGKEVFAKLTALRVVPCESRVLHAHEVMHEIALGWPKEIVVV
jgi:hypothetical protein